MTPVPTFRFSHSTLSRALPLLTARGAFILGAFVAVPPLLALFAVMGLAQALLLSAILGGGALLFALWEYLRVNKLLRSLELRAESPRSLVIGVPAEVRLELNQAPHMNMLVRLHLPDSLHCDPVQFQKEDASRKIILVPRSRGEFSFLNATVRASPDHGYFQWQFLLTAEPPITYSVEPNSSSLAGAIKKSPHLLHGGDRKTSFLATEGREFHELRPYVQGENLRRVDWKRSAKKSQLLVKHYRPESRERVMVFVDCSRRMAGAIGDFTALDLACNAALRIANRAAEFGDDFGIAAFDAEERAAMLPARTKAGARKVVNLLTTLRSGLAEPDYFLITARGLSLPRRSLIVLLTNLVMPASLELLRSALMPLSKKHLISIVALRDMDLEELRLSPLKKTEDAFVRAAAQHQMEEIEDRVRWLQRSGLHCVFAEPAALSDAADATYTTRKLEGRW